METMEETNLKNHLIRAWIKIKDSLDEIPKFVETEDDGFVFEDLYLMCIAHNAWSLVKDIAKMKSG